MLQPSTYLETDIAAGAGPYKHGRRLSVICSSVGLGAGLYGVRRQCYSPVCISRQFQQLAPALINTGASCRANAVLLAWALDLAESGANAIARYVSGKLYFT